MEYGKFTKFNNFMQSFRRWALAIIMFLPSIIIFPIMMAVISQSSVNGSSSYTYPIVSAFILSIISMWYIAEAILGPRNKFERCISDLKLDPPNHFDRESIRVWWKNTEPQLAASITGLISRASHAYKVAKYLEGLPNGSLISPKDLKLIANLGENATLLVKYHKFYTYMEKFPNIYPSGQMFLG